MTISDVHVGDVGTTYKARIRDRGNPFNPSAATTHELIFVKPDRTEVAKPATVTTDGSDWYFEYVAEADFHDQAGVWQWRPHMKFADDQEYRSAFEKFVVET